MKKFIIILSAITIAGCSNTIGTHVDITEIATGTSQSQIQNTLGTPTAQYKNNNHDVWEYDNTRVWFNTWYTVPFVGMFSNPYHYKRTLTQIIFDDDTVKDIKTFEKSGSITSKNILE